MEEGLQPQQTTFFFGQHPAQRVCHENGFGKTGPDQVRLKTQDSAESWRGLWSQVTISRAINHGENTKTLLRLDLGGILAHVVICRTLASARQTKIKRATFCINTRVDFAWGHRVNVPYDHRRQPLIAFCRGRVSCSGKYRLMCHVYSTRRPKYMI